MPSLSSINIARPAPPHPPLPPLRHKSPFRESGAFFFPRHSPSPYNDFCGAHRQCTTLLHHRFLPSSLERFESQLVVLDPFFFYCIEFKTTLVPPPPLSLSSFHPATVLVFGRTFPPYQLFPLSALQSLPFLGIFHLQVTFISSP